MFFATIIAAPLLLGLLTGLITSDRRVPLAIAAACVALGVAGAVLTAMDDDVTGRAGAVAFAVIAGGIGGLLVYGGWYAGREGRRRAIAKAPVA